MRRKSSVDGVDVVHIRSLIGVELGIGGGDAADVQVKLAVAEVATLCSGVVAVFGCCCAGWGLTRGGSRGDVGVGRLKVVASAPGVGVVRAMAVAVVGFGVVWLSISEWESSSLTSEGGSLSLSSELESESEDSDSSWGAELCRCTGGLIGMIVVAWVVRSRGGAGEGRGC